MSSISVVIPSLNDARMLEHCLAAVAAQSRQPDEVIVVDNGSTDDTVAVAEAAGARVVSEPQRGVLRATAAGFNAARGDIIGRLDADSRPAPDWVAHIERRFDADPTLTGLTGPGIFYGRGWWWRFFGQYIYIGGYFWFIGIIIGRVPVFGSNFALRREAWLDARTRIHLEDPRMHDDLDISFALDPDAGVEHDRGLVVQVSARPFDDYSGLWRRVSWGFYGMRVGLSDVNWWRRRRRCARGRKRRRAAQLEYARQRSRSIAQADPEGERDDRDAA
ncbi:MAG: glycosyltransferase family 2 protein [Leucobacter sp.]